MRVFDLRHQLQPLALDESQPEAPRRGHPDMENHKKFKLKANAPRPKLAA